MRSSAPPSPAPAACSSCRGSPGIWAPAGDARARGGFLNLSLATTRPQLVRADARGHRVPAEMDAAAHRSADGAPPRRAGLRRGRRALGRVGADPRRRLRPAGATARRPDAHQLPRRRAARVPSPRPHRSRRRGASSSSSAAATNRARSTARSTTTWPDVSSWLTNDSGPIFGGSAGRHRWLTRNRASASTRRDSAPTPSCAKLDAIAKAEDGVWADGRCSGTIYCGDRAIYDLIAKAYGHFSYVNVLQRDMCPSQTRFESEIIAMTLDMLHGDAARERGQEPCGVIGSGGSESIISAIYMHREWAPRDEGHHRAGDDPARDGARRLRQGRALLRREGDPGAGRSGDDARRRRLRAEAHQRQHRAAGRDRRGTTRTGRSIRSERSRISPSSTTSACTSTAASAASSCPGASSSATTSRPSTSGTRASRRSRRTPTSTATDRRAPRCCSSATSRCAAISTSRARTGRAACTRRPESAAAARGGLIAATWAVMVALGRQGYLDKARKVFETAFAMQAEVKQAHRRCA